MIIKATGPPGHGAKLYDNSALENLLKSIESVRRFRASQFDLVKAGLKAEGEVISVNMAFLKAGTPSPTVSLLIYVASFGVSFYMLFMDLLYTLAFSLYPLAYIIYVL